MAPYQLLPDAYPVLEVNMVLFDAMASLYDFVGFFGGTIDLLDFSHARYIPFD
jgi:hypothetical protein